MRQSLHLRALQLAAVLLYMGPLLAGLAGFGWAMVPPFVSIFVLWLILLRPQQWPRSNAEWRSRRAWLAALSQVLSQIVLVAVLFGTGRGIGGVLGTLPMFHPILPVAVSFVAIPLLRLFWDTDRALAEDLSIDELLYPRSAPPGPRPPVPAGAEAAVAPLLALDGTAVAEVDLRAALDEVLDAADGWARLSALSVALAATPTDRHVALRRALIDWATDPEGLAGRVAPGAMRAAFAAAGADEVLLRGLLPRALVLLRALPERAELFPDPAVIDDLARRGLPGDLAAGLAGLAEALRAARRPEGAPAAAPRRRGTAVGLRMEGPVASQG